MIMDFQPFFERYIQRAKAVDQLFEKIKGEYSDKVRCGIKCVDCCYAVFDIPLIEALYINHRFNLSFNGREKYEKIEKANQIDRKLHKIKRAAYKDFEAGKAEEEILLDMAKLKVRCPLLNEEDHCDLYDVRPITCRLYGIPLSIGGMGRTCGLSGFKAGESYPSVQLDILHRKLYELSNDLVVSIQSKHTRMGDILMPVSMALLTNFNEEYLGITQDLDTPQGLKDE
jgi:Fe-S-cluster containining protein